MPLPVIPPPNINPPAPSFELPPHIRTETDGYEVTISYPGNKIFVGRVKAMGETATAFSVFQSAASEINLRYQTAATAQGLFIASANGYPSRGDLGWQYAVNGIAKTTPPDKNQIKPGDRIQWFYGLLQTLPY